MEMGTARDWRKAGFAAGAGIGFALTTALLMGGCRLGNYSSRAPSPDQVTGYYDANPQSLKFCASSATTQCVSANTTLIPSFIADELTNPTALILQDLETGQAVFTAAVGGQTALPIWVEADDTTLYFIDHTTPTVLWRDSGCTTTLYLEEDGQIVRGAGHPVDGTNGHTVGSITLKVQVIRTFDGADGACAADLQDMHDCYQNVAQCGGVDAAADQRLQDRVRAYFEESIQAGAMTAADIPNVKSTAYEVHYQ